MADEEQVVKITDTIEHVVETYVPAVAPFHPLIAAVTTVVMNHFTQHHTWPTPEQVYAALTAEHQKLSDEWAAWTPSGDGTGEGETTG